jgi:3-oxoacyl-[acyl-carrier-protein] synthase-3
VLAGDVSTRLVNPLDKSVRMVFGDAGSATLVEGGADSVAFVIRTDGAGARHLMIPAGGCRRPADAAAAEVAADENGNHRSALDIFMDGMEIMNFGLREVPPTVDDALRLAGWNKDEAGSFVFHQANRFMLEYLRKKMTLPTAAVPIVMSDTGNTGPAAIPLALSVEHARLKRENRLQKCVLCGFGVGLSWGAAAADLSNTQILDTVEL